MSFPRLQSPNAFLNEDLAISGYKPDEFKPWTSCSGFIHQSQQEKIQARKDLDSVDEAALEFWHPNDPILHHLLTACKERNVPATRIYGVLNQLGEDLACQGQVPFRGERGAKLLRLIHGHTASYDKCWGSLPYAFLHNPDANALLQHLMENGYFNNVRRFLDVGCGNARDVVAVAKQVPSVEHAFGVDHSQQAVAHAQQNISTNGVENRASIVQGNVVDVLDKHPELIRTVDLVTFNSVLHLLTEQEAYETIQFVRKWLLSPTGIIAIAQKTPLCARNSQRNGAFKLHEYPEHVTRLCDDNIPRRFETTEHLSRWTSFQLFDVLHSETRRLSYASEQKDEFAWVIAQKQD